MSRTPTRPRRPGLRGWPGPYRGAAGVIPYPTYARGVTNMVCGMWPFATGAATPTVGVPLGRRLPSGHAGTGGVVCSDPVSWFLRAGLTRAPSAFVMGLNGLGKALDVDTPIPTPTGMARMGDLRPGDYVIGGDGAPVPIVAVSDVMTDRECWELEFSTGERIVADAEHQWLVWSENARGNARRGRTTSAEPVVMTTAQLAATRPQSTPRPRYGVKVCPPVQFGEDPELPVPPYTLGAWLGDGHEAHGYVTSTDPEILDLIRKDGFTVVAQPSCPDRYGVHGLRVQLRAAGVLGNKHVPEHYLRAREEDRRALLAGLLDTDGSCNSVGTVRFRNTNPALIAAVETLAASLGYAPRVRWEQPRGGFNCDRPLPSALVTFTPRDGRIVFGIPRKSSHQRVDRQRWRTEYRYITGARQVPTRPVRCIQVANPDGLFQVGRTFITTHNSTLVRRWCVGWDDYGIRPMILGDLKPDYTDLIVALGGQHVPVGRNRGYLNPLDIRYAYRASQRLTGEAREQLLSDARGRRAALMFALMTIVRRRPLEDRDEVILTRALRVLDDTNTDLENPPTVPDLLSIIRQAPDPVRAVAVDRGNDARYMEITEDLEVTLGALLEGDRLGGLFARQTSPAAANLHLDAPLAFDASSISVGEDDLAAAVLLACWSFGFGLIDAANALAEAGIEPQKHAAVVLDELWRPLNVGHGMPERINAITRLERSSGFGQVMITHTMSDLELPSATDTAKARGFIERAGMVALAGLPPAELEKLNRVVRTSATEARMITSWTTPGSWNPDTKRLAPPPGLGKFLLKVGTGEDPGIPVQVELSPQELAWNDTNKRWRDNAAEARFAQEARAAAELAAQADAAA